MNDKDNLIDLILICLFDEKLLRRGDAICIVGLYGSKKQFQFTLSGDGENMKGEFKEIVDKFPGWLDMLQKSTSFSRDQIKNVPNHGIYVFYDDDNLPLYVGRSDRMRTRLLEHSRPSSGHTSATFAFILAKEKLENPDMAITKSRNDLQSEEEFSPKYHEAKNDVSKMRVRVIEIINPVEQALFEIYVSLELNTPYNVWENH